MKQRFSSLDVKVIAHELNLTLSSLRVSNIYDLSSRIFLLKFQKPDCKHQIVIDSGFRCHLTSFVRTTAAAPSPFVQRLRKTLKSRRVTSVSQVGTDRIIQFDFSDGAYKLFLEFYAGGNIVLIDADFKILALLRNVDEGAEHERLRVGLSYNLSMRQNYAGIPELTKERVKQGLQKIIDKQRSEESTTIAKKGKKKTKDSLRKGLAVCINEFPPMLVDHAMKVKEFDSTLQPDEVLSTEEHLDKLLDVLHEAQDVIASIMGSETVTGYILAKGGPAEAKTANPADDHGLANEKAGLKYDDFHPFKPRQYEDDITITFLEFKGFNKTVDEFFSSIEGQKLESRLYEREEAARKKLQLAKQDHQKRIGGLQQVQQLNVRKGEAIQANVERVEEAQAAVNGLIAQGMDWVDIARLIEAEQIRDNPVAKLIKLPLKLYENTVTLLLGEAETDDNEDSDSMASETESESDTSEEEEVKKRPRRAPKTNDDELLAIDVDLSLSAWKNASQYYDQKKDAEVKVEKTLQSSSIALKSAERKIAADLKKGLTQEKEVLRPVRTQFWFEKFHYFISSDGYLVIGGKDAQQSEIIYRRYLRKGDIYIHADTNGASSVIIKNNPSTPEAPIPPSTLSQAGTLSIASSSAWDSKAMMAAWWVNSDQVSKTAPTGEFLAVGSFDIRGKKNFLPPAQMLLGFAVMFQISEESKINHQKHRIHETQKIDKEADNTSSNGEINQAEHDREDVILSNDESDDEFPDARLDAAAQGSDEEDFPDAELENTEDESVEERPSQAGIDSGTDTVDEDAVDEDEDEGQEDDEDEDEDENGDNAPGTNPLLPLAQLGVENYPHKIDGQQGVDYTHPMDGAIGHSAVNEMTPRDGLHHLSSEKGVVHNEGRDLTSLSSKLKGDDESKDDGTEDAARSVVSNTRPKNQPLPRGKRGKQKKAATKYAFQDEEDRALAMRLLGSKSGQETAAIEEGVRKEKEAAELINKQRRREQHLKAQATIAAGEAARRAAHEGGNEIGDDGEDEDSTRLSLLGLDAFTGRPLPGDDLLAAIPVCAPWSALATYKYKAKLQPGSMKKGKAVNEILFQWQTAGSNPKFVDRDSLDTERIWPREVELVKGLRGTEVNGVIPVTKVRVVMGGGGGSKANSASGKGKGNGKASRGGRGAKKKR